MRFKELYNIYCLRFKQENSNIEKDNLDKWSCLYKCCCDISNVSGGI